MADKTTHFGRAGEFFAMSELLLRGWNVAVPVVDLGDDVFVVDDNDKTTYRLQVKSAEPNEKGRYAFALSRRQLRAPLAIELFYMLLMRAESRWRYLIISRDELAAIRDSLESAPTVSRTGRPPISDTEAKSDALTLSVELKASSAIAWSEPLDRFLDQWPTKLPVILDGPGKRAKL